MTTPTTTSTPTPRRTRRTSVPLPDPTNPPASNNSEIIYEEGGNEATITEYIDGNKAATYQAKVGKKIIDETQINDNQDDLEGFGLLDLATPYQEIQKDPITQMFDDIQLYVEGGMIDEWFIQVTRMPDGMGDKFNIPCRERLAPQVVRLTSADRFNFVSEIQKLNEYSGGRFNIILYDHKQKPIPAPSSWNRTDLTYIEFSTVLANGTPPPIAAGTMGNDSGLFNYLQEQQKRQDEFNRQLLDTLRNQNQPRPSAIETAVQTKMVDMILNGGLNGNSNSGPEKMIENALGSMQVATAMAEGLASVIHREPVPPAPKTTFDHIMDVASHPMAQGIVERGLEVMDALASASIEKKMQNNGQPQSQPQPQPQPQHQQGFNPAPLPYVDQPPIILDVEPIHDENGQIEYNEENNEDIPPMQELVETIITELESGNPLDASNQTMQQLQADFPGPYMMIKMTCKGGTFDNVMDMLLEQTAPMRPFPFEPYIDFAAMQVAGNAENIIFNADGERIRARLFELYNYLRG